MSFCPLLALGAMYALTRSFWVPVLMHVVFNFLGSVVPALVLGHDNLSQSVIWIEIGCAAVSVAIIPYLYHRHRQG